MNRNYCIFILVLVVLIMGLLFESFLMSLWVIYRRYVMCSHLGGLICILTPQKLHPYVDDELIFISVIDTKQARTKLSRS